MMGGYKENGGRLISVGARVTRNDGTKLQKVNSRLEIRKKSHSEGS